MGSLVDWILLKKKEISDLEDMIVETFKMEKAREKMRLEKKKQKKRSKNCGTTIKGISYV